VPTDGHGLTDDVTPEAIARTEAQLRKEFERLQKRERQRASSLAHGAAGS